MKDIDEIRAGDEQHAKLFQEKNPFQPEKTYKLYTSPELNAYVSLIGKRIARVSNRPNLPYQFFIIDEEKIDIFGLGGGRVYVTRGLINFVESESELAGGLAHEIGHIARRHYYQPKQTRWTKAYDLMLKASEQAKGAAPPYTSGLPYGVKALAFGAKRMRVQFSGDQERQADELAVRFLAKAGYDPQGYLRLVERFSKVTIAEVGLFVDLLKSHPPLEGRREFIEKKVRDADKEFRKKKQEEADQVSFIQAIEMLLVDPEAQIAQLPTQKEGLPAVEPKAFASQS